MFSSSTGMRKFSLFFIFLIFTQAAAAESIITVEVLENGDATWILEKRVPLVTGEEIEDWEEFVQKINDKNQSQEDFIEFRNRIDWFINSAEKFSNRSMEAEKFNISYDTAKTLSGTAGVVRYSFEWKNFSRNDQSRIFIGDAFSEGMVLSSDNVLVIQIPDGYEVQSASPGFDRRDGNRLIWDGTLYRSFGKGEPAMVFSRIGFGESTWLIAAVMVGLISGASVILWKRRRSRIYNNGSDTLKTGTAEDILGYEEMIEQYLIKSGGQAYQSEIVKDSGLSASKISMVLAQMKEDGRIFKIRKGKENIIRIKK